uniref:Cytotardin n=1 Tax=Hypsibius exemplaris TaxID=2072580 RepID=CYTAR_HYPEX|nr:RecName: Full=Cytotardin [Hypsibius exemplaris]AME17872.1 cytotardin [Hypsibius dujardini]
MYSSMASSIRGSTVHLSDRVHSKDELQALNTRLAKYIDKIRNLENENVALQRQLQTAEQTTVTEIHRVSKNYDEELAKLRKQLEDVLRDNARLQMERNSTESENKQLQQRVAQLEKQVRTLEARLRQAEDLVADLQHRLSQSLDVRQQLESDNKDLKNQINSLKGQIQQLKQDYDNERVRTADLENKLQTKEEEHEFEKNALHENLREEKSQRQYLLHDLQRGLQDEFESKLVQQLNELRAEYDEMIKGVRAEVEAKSESRIRDLMAMADQQGDTVTRLQQELEEWRKRSQTTEAELDRLRKENANLNAQLTEIQRQKDDQIRALQQQIRKRQEELQRINDDLGDLTRQYQDLLYVKLALDAELATYNKLLSGEEQRLGMDGSGTVIRRPTGGATGTGSGIYGGTGSGGYSRDIGSTTTTKTTYTSRPTYNYTPIATTPIGGTSTTGRYTPVGGQTLAARQPSPGGSLGRERDIPVLREQKITETFKASGRVGPRTDW